MLLNKKRTRNKEVQCSSVLFFPDESVIFWVISLHVFHGNLLNMPCLYLGKFRFKKGPIPCYFLAHSVFCRNSAISVSNT